MLSENTDISLVILAKQLWGIFFTVTSYLVTMGNESSLWFNDFHSLTSEMTVVALMGLTINWRRSCHYGWGSKIIKGLYSLQECCSGS